MDGGYDREQVAEILRRAAEIERERRDGDADSKLSLTDLEGIAQESGLDPSAVRAAAAEIARAQHSDEPAAVPRPPSGTQLHHRRQFEGELEDADLERLVERSGTRVHLPGSTTRQGDAWHWLARWGNRRLHLRAESRRGRTTIEADEDLQALAATTHAGLLGGLAILGLAGSFLFGISVESTLSGAAVMTAIGTTLSAATGYVLSRVMFSRFRLVRDVQLQRLVDELAEEGRELVGRASNPNVEAAAREPAVARHVDRRDRQPRKRART